MSSRMNASVILFSIVWTKYAAKVNVILHNICFICSTKESHTGLKQVIILVNNLLNVYVAFQISTCVHTEVLRPRVSDFGSSVPSGQILVGLFSVGFVFNFILAINSIHFLVLTVPQVMQVHPQHPHLHQVNFYLHYLPLHLFILSVQIDSLIH